MPKKNEEELQTFENLKESLLRIDPVVFCERYLTLDGKPFRLHGNGFKPFADLYRYIGIKALEKTAKPVIMVKGRQIGGTTMAQCLEMYFMGCGLFGVGNNPPIRIIHAFPQLEMAAVYSKTKLNPMINSSIIDPADQKGTGRVKSYMQKLLDPTSATNDSLSFKQFINGNHLWIDSTGIDADRLRGRQICLETDIPTPNGFIKLKDLKAGDHLFDEQGNICNVVKLHPIDLLPESYKIYFDDNTTVDACADHLWLTYTRSDRLKEQRFKRGAVKTPPDPTIKKTKEIFETIKYNNGGSFESNHSIPNTLPLNYEEKNLEIDSYLLGLWLGDGDAGGRIELLPEDEYILNNFNYHIIPTSIRPKISKSCSYRVVGLTTKLRKLRLNISNYKKINNFYKKRIPLEYLHSSFQQRLDLLCGLLDSDGSCDKNGRIEFCSTQAELAEDVFQLILSLGIKAHMNESENYRYKKRTANRFRINFVTKLSVFRLKRKLDLIKSNIKAIHMSTHRYIVNVKKIDSKPMRCITVDSNSGLFLITKKFIPTHNTADGMFFDEVQDTPGIALSNATKILSKAQYGSVGNGVQVYFGTPKKKGSDFYKMWESSSQQYYHLGCERCKKYFPLYTPGSDDWEKIWLYGFIVKCTHCGCEQNKLDAQERGKWFALKDESDASMIGFHMNQLYIPEFPKEKIMSEKPGVHPVNTERAYQNEVLGEFFQGDSSPITPEEIRDKCGDVGRKMRAIISPGEESIVTLGIDYGARSDMEQLANPNKKAQGQSYSTAVVLTMKGPNLLSIEFATKFKRNDTESKKGIIDNIMRQYSVNLAIGDIGFSQDFSTMLHTSYGDRYLVSRAQNKINGKIKYDEEIFPKEIKFERDYYIGELFELMKKGQIKFPFGDYEKIGWLVNHCSSMDIKPSISKYGDPTIHYVKGGGPNDGFMALLNAYLAYKFIITSGFTNNNPLLQQHNLKEKNRPLAVTGLIRRKF